jgi:uncharacterized protein YceK
MAEVLQMKWMVAALTVTLGGCASVTELEQSRETLDVISGKTPVNTRLRQTEAGRYAWPAD